MFICLLNLGFDIFSMDPPLLNLQRQQHRSTSLGVGMPGQQQHTQQITTMVRMNKDAAITTPAMMPALSLLERASDTSSIRFAVVFWTTLPAMQRKLPASDIFTSLMIKFPSKSTEYLSLKGTKVLRDDFVKKRTKNKCQDMNIHFTENSHDARYLQDHAFIRTANQSSLFMLSFFTGLLDWM